MKMVENEKGSQQEYHETERLQFDKEHDEHVMAQGVKKFNLGGPDGFSLSFSNPGKKLLGIA